MTPMTPTSGSQRRHRLRQKGRTLRLRDENSKSGKAEPTRESSPEPSPPSQESRLGESNDVPVSACEFCPHGMAVSRDFVLSVEHDATCGTFVDFASVLTADNDQCNDVRFRFVEEICCLSGEKEDGSSDGTGGTMEQEGESNEAPSEQEEGETEEGADPTCSGGIPRSLSDGSGVACCSSSCGSCGGEDCASRPGGAEGCCAGRIARGGRSCATHSAPCFPVARRGGDEGIVVANGEEGDVGSDAGSDAANSVAGALSYRGCTADRPCGACEGGCDADSSLCDEGLECLVRDGVGVVPGCSGAGITGELKRSLFFGLSCIPGMP